MTEKQQLARRDENAIASSGTGIPVEQRMAMLREALTNPDVDPAKAVAMADLMFKLEDRDRQAEFNRDLIAAKKEIGPIFKRGENKHQKTKYAKFEDIQRVTDPILERHGLDLSYKIGSEGPNVTVVPVLRHINGWEWEGLAIKGPPDTGPGRSAIQSVGSSSSYLQRYAAKGTLNLRFDGEDDDAVMPRAGDALNDRQHDVVVDAQAAYDAGEYASWFSRQSTKDKALLVQIGLHASLGGGRLLPGSEKPPTPAPARDPEPVTQQAQERPKPAERQPEPKPGGNHDVSTPDGWAAQYVDDCDAAPDMDALNRVSTKGAAGLKRLADGHPKLWEKCDFAMLEARERLKESDQ